MDDTRFARIIGAADDISDGGLGNTASKFYVHWDWQEKKERLTYSPY